MLRDAGDDDPYDNSEQSSSSSTGENTIAANTPDQPVKLTGVQKSARRRQLKLEGLETLSKTTKVDQKYFPNLTNAQNYVNLLRACGCLDTSSEDPLDGDNTSNSWERTNPLLHLAVTQTVKLHPTVATVMLATLQTAWDLAHMAHYGATLDSTETISRTEQARRKAAQHYESRYNFKSLTVRFMDPDATIQPLTYAVQSEARWTEEDASTTSSSWKAVFQNAINKPANGHLAPDPLLTTFTKACKGVLGDVPPVMLEDVPARTPTPPTRFRYAQILTRMGHDSNNLKWLSAFCILDAATQAVTVYCLLPGDSSITTQISDLPVLCDEIRERYPTFKSGTFVTFQPPEITWGTNDYWYPAFLMLMTLNREAFLTTATSGASSCCAVQWPGDLTNSGDARSVVLSWLIGCGIGAKQPLPLRKTNPKTRIRALFSIQLVQAATVAFGTRSYIPTTAQPGTQTSFTPTNVTQGSTAHKQQIERSLYSSDKGDTPTRDEIINNMQAQGLFIGVCRQFIPMQLPSDKPELFDPLTDNEQDGQYIVAARAIGFLNTRKRKRDHARGSLSFSQSPSKATPTSELLTQSSQDLL
jgi:hypothetical protein